VAVPIIRLIFGVSARKRQARWLARAANGGYWSVVPLLFLAFTLLPFAELYLLIRIGRVAGPLPTVALVVLTALAGAALAKGQGRRVLREWREALAAGQVPREGVIGGILVLVGGLLLITPGVLTDIAGLLCLLPATRRMIGSALTRHLAQKVAAGQVQVQRYGFEWPPRAPSQQPPIGRPSATRPAPKPFRRDDVIDTEGEEV
jgi:UPF0716 protein FxsA